MKLKINGEIKTIDNSNEDFLLEGLLEHLGYKPQLVVVELNGEIINPKVLDKYKNKKWRLLRGCDNCWWRFLQLINSDKNKCSNLLALTGLKEKDFFLFWLFHQ